MERRNVNETEGIRKWKATRYVSEDVCVCGEDGGQATRSRLAICIYTRHWSHFACCPVAVGYTAHLHVRATPSTEGSPTAETAALVKF
jgi:hypothetical protein